MIIVTGAAGFIGSCLLGTLNRHGFADIVLVDDFSNVKKNKNFAGKRYASTIDREEFIPWLIENKHAVQFIFHMGARTDTTESSRIIFDRFNLNYTKAIWNSCCRYRIPLIYASSAATYGLGEYGYEDSHEIVNRLRPLNAYGDSKNEFDKWALAQQQWPCFWAGLKFFNVYGPNEFHKGRMASVVLHAFNQIKKTGIVQLFQSHNADYKDGGQLRDFVYVKDVVEACIFLLKNKKDSGLYNLGSGTARTFLDLANNTFAAMGKKPKIHFIPMPEDIRDKYQYFTKANINKLRSIGYHRPFHTLETGIEDYVKNYLIAARYY